jgi:hypothetical protein
LDFYLHLVLSYVFLNFEGEQVKKEKQQHSYKREKEEKGVTSFKREIASFKIL